uniref:D-lactate dehydratase n=1 Tax=Panagrellus redivivus TaxID=6233 RepID=A0A7E4V4F0_PANRE
MAKSALVIVFPGVEDIETSVTVDLLRRAEVNVTTASLNDASTITMSKKTIITPDAKLSDVESKDFDAIIVPGGPGTFEILENAKLGALLKKYEAAGKIVAAICAAPLIFTVHGVGKDGTVTSYPGVRDKIVAAGYAYSDEKVVVSKNIVSSRGPATSFDFALKLIELLKGKESADQVSKAILYTH